MPFMDGDVVVGFTDGLVEIEVEQGDQWDESVLADFVAGLEPEVRHRPDEVIQQLLAHVRQRATSWNRDDVTVIAASRTS
jgi:serine phosphatase RsbU (regulator of sigma subunit)